MKKLITLALASTMTLMLAGCGDTTPYVIDTSAMTTGENNKTGLGGYWWTYVDRSGQSVVTPNTGKVAPNDPIDTKLQPGIAQGNGVEDDGSGSNLALHVTGTVSPAPAWSATLGTTTCTVGTSTVNWCDEYVNTNNGSLCADGKCGEVKYPAAGLGFGFKEKNRPLGTNAVGKVGIAFKIKLGATHGATKTVGVSNPIAISLPLDLTDVPDKSFGDEFGTAHAAGTLHSGAPIPQGVNAPFCSFPQSLQADGTTVVGGTNKTCFANLATIINPPPVAGQWNSYCVTWDAFVAPGWAVGLGLPAVGLPALTTDLAQRIIKMQFDAYKPTPTEVAAPFDFYVDDVYLLDAENSAEHCTGAVPIVSEAAP